MKQVGVEGLALFSPPPVSGKRPTLAQRYLVWRATKEGTLVFREVEARCLEEARLSAKRIEVNRIFATVRAERKLRCNNDWRAPMAAELLRTHPMLVGLIRTKRKAA